MKTFLKVAAVVFILMLALPFMLQLHMIEVEDGKAELLYVPLSGGGAGGSVGVDIRETLRMTYGEEGVPVEAVGYWKGKTVIIADTHEYQLEYIGEALNGWAEYMRCTVVTNRTVKDVATGERLAGGMRISTMPACNEFGNEKRAYIIWNTLKEEFYGTGFDVALAF